MRIAAGDLRERQSDLAQGLVACRLGAPLIAGAAEAPRRQEQVVVELPQRIEGLERVLEDRLHGAHEGLAAAGAADARRGRAVET